MTNVKNRNGNLSGGAGVRNAVTIEDVGFALMQRKAKDARYREEQREIEKRAKVTLPSTLNDWLRKGE